jgi:predicted DNA-binding protein with PD1-like motif
VRSAELQPGRRLLLVLENGDDVVTAITDACREHAIDRAIVPVFLGAFTEVVLIGTHEPVDDPDAPLPASVTVSWVEGTGSATLAPDASGASALHLHMAVGVKADGSTAYAGHVLSARAHYTVELVVEEIVGAPVVRRPDDRAHGLPTLFTA